jgi:hypothetical protein
MSRATALRRARIVRSALLDHGVPQVSIELHRGRPASGDDWSALNPLGVLSHHIASRPTRDNPTPGLALVKRGRSDLPGPLANGTAGLDLIYRIICLGYANHSGFGGPWVVHGPLGSFRIPADNGRPYLWGTEYEGGFSDEVWDREYEHRPTHRRMTFREFMGRCNAGLVEAIWEINTPSGRPTKGMDLSGYHGEHKTWAPGRKTDRRNYTTKSGRAEIRRFNVPVEDDMQLSDDIYIDRDEELTVRELFHRLDQFMTRSAERDARLRKLLQSQARAIKEAIRRGATQGELEAMIDSLEADLRDLVQDPP